MKKIGVIFDYEESWMVIRYSFFDDGNLKAYKYWNEYENNFDDAIDVIEATCEEVFNAKFKTNNDIQNWMSENKKSIFSLSYEDIMSFKLP